MKRKKRCKKAPAEPAGSVGLPKIRPLVAGIDVGSENHYVCAPSSEGGTEVRVFGASTPQLLAIAEWLEQAQVESVAMESTGVYWSWCAARRR